MITFRMLYIYRTTRLHLIDVMDPLHLSQASQFLHLGFGGRFQDSQVIVHCPSVRSLQNSSPTLFLSSSRYPFHHLFHLLCPIVSIPPLICPLQEMSPPRFLLSPFYLLYPRFRFRFELET